MLMNVAVAVMTVILTPSVLTQMEVSHVNVTKVLQEMEKLAHVRELINNNNNNIIII